MPVYVWLLENPANKHLAHEGHSTDTSRNYALAELGAKNAIYSIGQIFFTARKKIV